MQMKRITMRVPEDLYNKWKAVADKDHRTLTAWLLCRAEGLICTEPGEEEPVNIFESALQKEKHVGILPRSKE